MKEAHLACKSPDMSLDMLRQKYGIKHCICKTKIRN